MTKGAQPASEPALDRIAIALYATVAIAIAFLDFYVRRNPAYAVAAYIPQVLAGTYEAPFIYRPLAPWLMQAFANLSGLSPMAAFEILRYAGILGALAAFHALLRVWYSSGACIGATMTMAALLPFSMTNSWPVPGTYLELALFSLGALAVVRRADGWFALILAVSSLNRETSVFLLLLWVADRARTSTVGQWMPRGAMLGAVWLAGAAGVRLAWGLKPYKVFVFGQNLVYLNVFDGTIDPRLRLFAWFWLVMLAVPVYLAVRGLRAAGAPAFAGPSLLVGLAYVGLCLVAASIVEPRVLLPALPLIAPAAMAYVTSLTAAPRSRAV